MHAQHNPFLGANKVFLFSCKGSNTVWRQSVHCVDRENRSFENASHTWPDTSGQTSPETSLPSSLLKTSSRIFVGEISGDAPPTAPLNQLQLHTLLTCWYENCKHVFLLFLCFYSTHPLFEDYAHKTLNQFLLSYATIMKMTPAADSGIRVMLTII